MKKNKSKSTAPTITKQSNTHTEKVKVLPPRNLTPPLCERLKRELLEACKKVAATHGLVVEGGDLSDIDLRHGFAIDFSVGIPMADGSLYSAEKAMFEVFAEHFGLEASDYGCIFRTRDEAFRITAINPNRPKYPISAERVADGQGFKFPAKEVSLYLSANET